MDWGREAREKEMGSNEERIRKVRRIDRILHHQNPCNIIECYDPNHLGPSFDNEYRFSGNDHPLRIE